MSLTVMFLMAILGAQAASFTCGFALGFFLRPRTEKRLKRELRAKRTKKGPNV